MTDKLREGEDGEVRLDLNVPGDCELLASKVKFEGTA